MRGGIVGVVWSHEGRSHGCRPQMGGGWAWFINMSAAHRSAINRLPMREVKVPHQSVSGRQHKRYYYIDLVVLS